MDLKGLWGHWAERVGAWPWPSQTTTDYRLSEKLKHSAHEMYLMTRVEWTTNNSFWSWSDVNRSTFDEDMWKKRFLHFHSQWPCWPLDIKLAPSVTLVQRYVSTKLEVSMAFLFSKKSEARDGRMSGMQHFMWPPKKGCITMQCKHNASLHLLVRTKVSLWQTQMVQLPQSSSTVNNTMTTIPKNNFYKIHLCCWLRG